ncbi:MAG TPA: S41 family peptidase [Fimbriiglobus sp.]|jgi:tricorn protease
MSLRIGLFAALAGFVGPAIGFAQDETRLLRFPTTHGDTVIFTYAGNLFTVPSSGGIARRLTNHDGYQMFPRLSPDGKWVAFTGQYDGNTEVYTMPAEGGVPKRLTFTATLGRDDVSDRMGPNNLVMGWTPDGKNVLFRSRMHSFNDFLGQLYTVPKDGGIAVELPLPRGGFASYSPDGKKIAYNRVFREFRTWKRYRGGMADDVWTYDFDTKKTERLVENPAQDIIPMWHGNTVYFLSDRDANKRMNLYKIDLGTKQTTTLTTFTDFDCKFPSLGDKAIVFENGGWIYKLDCATDKVEKLKIRILEDGAAGRTVWKDVSKQITGFDVSPDGKRGLFSTHGDAFTVPAEKDKGITRNLTNTSGVHERDASWSPDGKSIAYISDATGGDEIYTRNADGTGTPVQVTSGADTYKFAPDWSPDSTKIAWGDKKLRLQYVDVNTKKVTLINQAEGFETRDHAWSPDSKWVAFARNEAVGMNKCYLFSLADGKTNEATDGFFNASNPRFSPDGKYLYFVSSRDFSPTYGQTEFNHIYQDMNKVYLCVLAKDGPNPFAPKLDDDASAKSAEKKDADKKDGDKKAGDKKDNDKKDGDKKDGDKKGEKKPAVVVKVDADGLTDRVLALAVPAANYRNISPTASGVYYVRQSSKVPQPHLCYFDLATKKETACGVVGNFAPTPDGKKMLVTLGGKFAVIAAPKAPVTISEGMDLSGLRVLLDRHAEWKEIFEECWRQERDFFYDPHMHGVDWAGMKKKYEVLVPYVQHRADLTYIIGEMIGELNVGHAYVGGGDEVQARRIPTGLLGAEFQRDPATGFFKITKILKGANWSAPLRSPLTEIGVNVKVGDYIVAVDGKPASTWPNLLAALVDTVDKPVRLSVNAEPKLDGARTVVVTPTGDEAPLYYNEWVEGNIEKVSKASGGKIGYLHIPDMQQVGLNEFVKHYYPQLGKKALIVDVRGNGGGNVSPMIIERLRRKICMIDIARNTAPSVDPDGTFDGPLACLMNEFSASDGDLFSYRFKYYKLGPLIGKRSWGGVVGIRGTLPLMDGGNLNRPEFSRYDTAGKKWIIEGHGVDPDIVVDNDPADEYAGKDAQLNRAVDELMKALKNGGEKTLPPAPPYPNKSK